MEFNLVDDDWLPVVFTDGSPGELSLREVLVRAHEVRSLALDVPSQVPPVVRLLLAVAHRALAGPTDEKQWRTWWDEAAFNETVINSYLDEYRSRFGLFDAQAPFMQGGGLQALNGKTKTAALLVPHVASGNNVPLFSAERDARPDALSPAQAARWLLHAHAWDTAAIKTGAVGDKKAKAGKTTGNPVGALGQLGVIMPMGPTLWHTLMCNLLPTEAAAGGDLPVWERPPLTGQWAERMPKGRLELYTWPARRIRLIPEPDAGLPGGVAVRKVVVCGGDRIALTTGQELRGWMSSEPHSAWKRSENLERKRKFPLVYWPVRHRVERQLWRGLAPLLARAELPSTAAGKDAPTLRGPAVLAQLGTRERLSALKGMPLRVLAVGFEYGNQSAVIDEAYGDELPLPIAVLSAQDDDWRNAVLDAVAAAEGAVRALAYLAENLAVASGCRPSEEGLLAGHRERARETAYAELDAPFRRWLALLADDADPDEALDRWAHEVQQIIRSQARELLASTSPAAFHGQASGAGDDAQVMDAFLAEIFFHRALHKALRELFDTDTDTDGPDDDPTDLEHPE
ncbi:type I-E CRISPR-associated protein Cse1/CasA [Streptomyces natalensis]|uniref:type I-E CRISPR-associated protein Cse1/CasA n=1 Tax=Streptomyces natalensis TaxID=68242 RepID=UPI00068CF26E|nr:type I-E CRISPR-associated protein Cse1/CasA [Streptomyces natalensis]